VTRSLGAAAMLACALASSCACWEPVDAATAARVRPMALAGIVPGRCELELATPGLAGTFDAVVARDGEAVRLQLFPEVGGKVLDLRLDASGVTADLGGVAYRAAPPLDQAAPHLALVLALAVGELGAPVTPDRVVGVCRRGGVVTEVELAAVGALPAVVATLAADGAITGYAWRLHGVGLRLGDDGRFEGPGFAGWLRR
jgi:hypothetical protein